MNDIFSKNKETLIRKLVREILNKTYQSHSFEPAVGDNISNINTNCKHFGSEGTVLDIESLPDDAGKVIVYQVTNDGSAYSPGDVLRKTPDQLGPRTQ